MSESQGYLVPSPYKRISELEAEVERETARADMLGRMYADTATRLIQCEVADSGSTDYLQQRIANQRRELSRLNEERDLYRETVRKLVENSDGKTYCDGCDTLQRPPHGHKSGCIVERARKRLEVDDAP